MAEIRVEPDNRDNRPSIWPWILGALLLIGVVWAAVTLLDDDEPERELATTTAPVERDPASYDSNNEYTQTDLAATGPVAEFIRFANDENYERENVANTNTATTEAEMDMEHKYTSEGIEKLSAALNALAANAAGDASVDQSREKFQQRADQLQKDPESLQHANMIRETFVEASNLMATIKERSYPDSNADVEDVQEAAESIDVNTPTLEQKDKVKEFYEKAGDAIEEMADQGSTQVEQDRALESELNR